MYEALKPQRYNPNAARPPGESAQNVTVESTLDNQSATLPNGETVNWGNPVEQTVVVQPQPEPPVVEFREVYQGMSVDEAERLRDAENAAPGTAQVTYIDDVRRPGIVHKVAPLSGDGQSTHDHFYDPNYVPGSNSTQLETRTVVVNNSTSGHVDGSPNTTVLGSQPISAATGLTNTVGMTTTVGAEPTVTQGISVGEPIKIGEQITVDNSKPVGGEPGSEVISVATVTPTVESGKNPGVITLPEATPTPTSQFEGLKNSVKG